MSREIVALMRLAALALDVDEAFFDDKVDRSIGTMRLNYYPAQAIPPRPGQLRASAHTDYGGFTILSGEDVPGGLQVRTRREQWVDVPTSPTTFVVNIGEPPHALDERPLALEHAPRGESLGRRRPAPPASVCRVLQPPELRHADRVPGLAGAGAAPARALRRVPRREVCEDGADRRHRRRSSPRSLDGVIRRAAWMRN